MGKRNRDTCRYLFKELKILPFKLRYILSLLLFVTGITDNFIKNLEQCSINIYIYTKHNKDLYLPQPNLAIYQKGVHYSGVKIFNNLPSDIRSTLRSTRRFKNLVKHL
jgi:hypothetical protein